MISLVPFHYNAFDILIFELWLNSWDAELYTQETNFLI